HDRLPDRSGTGWRWCFRRALLAASSMTFLRSSPKSSWLITPILPIAFLLLTAGPANGACSITSTGKTWIYNVADTYTITTSGGSPNTYSATGLPPGLSIPNPSQNVISGTPTAGGTYSVNLTVIFNGNCTATTTVTFNVVLAAASTFVGFRLP